MAKIWLQAEDNQNKQTNTDHGNTQKTKGDVNEE
jgi:hypothetical protein